MLVDEAKQQQNLHVLLSQSRFLLVELVAMHGYEKKMSLAFHPQVVEAERSQYLQSDVAKRKDEDLLKHWKKLT